MNYINNELGALRLVNTIECIEKVMERIYTIRNGIAHSKREFDFKMHPNMIIESKLTNDIILLENLAHYLLINYSYKCDMGF